MIIYIKGDNEALNNNNLTMMIKCSLSNDNSHFLIDIILRGALLARHVCVTRYVCAHV